MVSVEEDEYLCLTLEKLIETKRAAGRAKDYEAISELEAILEDRGISWADMTDLVGVVFRTCSYGRHRGRL